MVIGALIVYDAIVGALIVDDITVDDTIVDDMIVAQAVLPSGGDLPSPGAPGYRSIPWWVPSPTASTRARALPCLIGH